MKINYHIACEDEVHTIVERPVEPCVVDFGCMCDRFGYCQLVQTSNNTFQGTIQDCALSVLDELF
jgi:hypothetical protein